MQIRRIERSDRSEWLRMARALFEGESLDEDELELEHTFSRADAAVFGIDRGDGKLGGYVEVGARSIADGCITSPVGYIEAWYVDPDLRQSGWGRKLIEAAEDWSRSKGYTEMGSDALIDNDVSHEAHRRIGFQEVSRVIVYRKDLQRSGAGTLMRGTFIKESSDKREERVSDPQNVVITPEGLLKHWQGHRGLTRRMIEAFPEKELFSFSIGGMRPFSDLAMEFIGMGSPTLKGVVSREWSMDDNAKPATKAELLKRWDEETAEINKLWAQIPSERFQETDTAFGQWTMPIHDLLLYVIDNEVHHRGQGYVYLRALGIDPPPFYDRY